MKTIPRRSFLGWCFAAGAASACASVRPLRAQSSAAAQKTARILLGGPVFLKSDDPAELARAHQALGYRAAYCPRVNPQETDRMREIERAFGEAKVVVAEVGRWVNLLDPDAEKRRANLQYVTDGLAIAEGVGARCCVDIAGSFNPKIWYGPHPDNFSDRFFDGAVENARKIIDAVKPKRTKFAYEMMGWALPAAADDYVKLIKAVDRSAFGVHLDPCNLVHSPGRYYRNSELIQECFDKLGSWIVSCHAKDLVWDVEMNVHFREVRPGAGEMDYRRYLRCLATLPQSPPLMLEHLANAEEYDKARSHLQKLGTELGLDLG